MMKIRSLRLRRMHTIQRDRTYYVSKRQALQQRLRVTYDASRLSSFPGPRYFLLVLQDINSIYHRSPAHSLWSFTAKQPRQRQERQCQLLQWTVGVQIHTSCSSSHPARGTDSIEAWLLPCIPPLTACSSMCAQAGAAGSRASNSLLQSQQQQSLRTQLRRRLPPKRQLSAFTAARPTGIQLHLHVHMARRQQLEVSKRLQPTHNRSFKTSSSTKQLQPDPAADDLDMLIAQAAAVVPCISTSSSSSRGRSTTAASPRVNVSTGEAPRKLRTDSAALSHVAATTPGSGGASCGVVQQPLRYTAADKLGLTEAEARAIARRLRTPRAPQRGEPVLRVFRYGIDDLRLYKALDAAGLEGRVVVVDSVDFADAVVTTIKKRTGKNVNQAIAKRAAAGAGIPCFVLKAVSAERVVEALGPMLGIVKSALPSSLMEGSMQPGQPQGQQSAADERAAQQVAAFAAAPRQLRADEVGDDSFQQLLQLLWGPSVMSTAAATELVTGSGKKGVSSCSNWPLPLSPRWEAWHASQWHSTVQELFELVKQIDVEDSRDYMLPANPNARAGERYKLMKPLRHNSRLRKKLLNKDLAAKQAHW